MARSTSPFVSLASVVSFASVALIAGCAADEATPPQTPVKPQASANASAAASASAAPTAVPGHLARGDVEKVLRQGPPWLLRRVTAEEVIRGGKFIGWRILTMPGDWNVDLKSGDIVMRANGLALERPDDLFAIWMQLQSAVELRISYERDGKARDLVMPIDGPSTAGTLSQTDATPPPPPRPNRWQTIVIEGDDAPPPAPPE